MNIRISKQIQVITEYAREEAMRTGWYGISADHLMLGLLRHGINAACQCLSNLGADLSSLKKHIESKIFLSNAIPYNELHKVGVSQQGKEVMSLSTMEALKNGTNEVLPAHLLIAISRAKDCATMEYLSALQIHSDRLIDYFASQNQIEGSRLSDPCIKAMEIALGEQLKSLIKKGKNRGKLAACNLS